MHKLKVVIAAVLLVIVLVGVEIYIIRGASGYEPEVDAVFAKRRIAENSIITEDMLEVRKIGAGMAHRLSARKPGDIAGKKARTDIESGEMLLTVKAGYEEMKEISVNNRNNRLFAVEFKGDQANGWWLLVGQKVDIIFIPKEADGQQPDTVGTPSDSLPVKSLKKLENIRVAALIDEKGKMLENNERLTLPRYVSFEVTREQADFLADAKGGGRLELSVIPGE